MLDQRAVPAVLPKVTDLLKPCESDLVMMRHFSQGFTVVESGKAAGYSLSLARSRIRQMKARTGAKSVYHLNYLMHCNYWLTPLWNSRAYESPTPIQLEAVQELAWGKSISQMARQWCLTELAVESRLVRARRITKSKNNVHLITRCWSRDLIV
jgi:DNA-binding CsgD family transcriptional regulator